MAHNPRKLPFWRNWRTRDFEREEPLVCDSLIIAPEDVLHRAIDVKAPVSFLFARICQLRVAPYSYDLLDNLGRKSPAHLSVSVSDLTPGDPIMTIFKLHSLIESKHFTIYMDHSLGLSLFGQIAITYWTRPLTTCRSRLVIRALVQYPPRYPARAMRYLLPIGDWFMCQKQLRMFRRYAEADYQSAQLGGASV